MDAAYRTWRNSRVRFAKVAGIDVSLRVASPALLKSCGSELLELLDQIDSYHYDGTVSRRDMALLMSEALAIVLPKVIVSPDWLLQAVGEFSEDEVIELYNTVMHGSGTEEVGEIPF